MPSANITTHTPMDKLTAKIATNVTIINNYLKENDLPILSLERDSPAEFPVPSSERDIHLARLNLIEAAKAMYDLALGPVDMLGWSAMTSKYECASLRAIVSFNLAGAVPLDGEASFSEIAERTNLNEEFVCRIIRFATTTRIFNEHRPGYVVHTAASAVLAQDEITRGNIGHNLDEVFPSAAKLNEAAKTVESGEPNNTPFNLAFNTDKPFFDYINDHEGPTIRFHQSMKAWTTQSTYSAEHILTGCDWGSIPHGLVADVGGAHGHISMTIARKFKNLSFIVQDQPDAVNDGQACLPADMRGRIAFMAYDFLLQQQPVAADIYLLRWIMHDWSTKYCQRILRNIIPAMRPGARIVIMETVLPPANTVPKVQEKLQRSVDLQMMALLNGRERTLEDWKDLFHTTDERLVISNITIPPGSTLSVIEVMLKAE